MFRKLIGFILSLSIFSTLAASNNINTDFNSTPENLVLSYIQDYYLWNKYAVTLDTTFTSLQQTSLAEKKYQKDIIEKYCLPFFKHEPIAYGTSSSHDPKLETITSTKLTNNEAIIHTKLYNKDLNYYDIYEYHLIKTKKIWYLTTVYYLLDGQKYSGL